MKSINRRIVSAYIISSDGKLLLGRKNPKRGGVYADCWHNPGGGVDGSETDKEALKREVFEETGIDISDSKTEFIDDKGRGESVRKLISGEEVLARMQFNIYKVSLSKSSDEIKLEPSDDLEGFQWFAVDEFRKIKLTPPALELLGRTGEEWLKV